MVSISEFFTANLLELLGTDITPLKILILLGIFLAFYLSSRYFFVPILRRLLEKIRIEEDDRDLIGKLFYVFFMSFGIILGFHIIGLHLMMFFSEVLLKIQTVEVTVLDLALFIAIFIPIYLISGHVLVPLFRKLFKRLEIDEDKISVLLRTANYLVILGGFYVALRYLSSKLLEAVLSYEIIHFVGTTFTPEKIILAVLAVSITYLVSKYLIVAIIDKILAWVGTKEDDRSTLQKIVHTLIILAGIYGAIRILGLQTGAILSISLFAVMGSTITLADILSFILTLLIAYLVSKFVVQPALNKILREGGVKKKNRESALKITHYFIVFLGIYIGVNVLGVQLTSLLAVAGVAGIVLGFGLQPIVSNLVSGLLLMGERTVRVGDWVEFELSNSRMYGVVIDTGIRASTIRTLDNKHVLVPNSSFAQSPFTNYSHQDTRIRISTSVSVAYGTDVEKVKEILLNIAEEHDRVMDLPEPSVYFEEFGNSSLNFRLTCWISDPKFRQEVKSDLNFEVNRRFKEEDITIPFPQRDVHIKGDKKLTEKQIEEEEDL